MAYRLQTYLRHGDNEESVRGRKEVSEEVAVGTTTTSRESCCRCGFSWQMHPVLRTSNSATFQKRNKHEKFVAVVNATILRTKAG